LLRVKAGLDAEGAAGALLAGQAMADGDAERLAGGLDG